MELIERGGLENWVEVVVFGDVQLGRRWLAGVLEFCKNVQNSFRAFDMLKHCLTRDEL